MLVIGIAGGTGSGKTTVVRKIMEQLPCNEIAVLPQDAYYRDNGHLSPEERQKINFDHPDSIEFDLLVEHLLLLKQGKPVNQPVYSYLSCTRAAETVTIEPKKVVIVEGILILCHAGLRDLMDLKVFVDAEPDDRLMRVIQRDIAERGRTVDKVLVRYEETVKPMHLQFIEPTKRYSDLIVPQGGNNRVAIDILTQYILRILSHQS
jgi:uridine kinase